MSNTKRETFSHEESELWRRKIYKEWQKYVKKCESILARPNARAFVKNWNKEYPEKNLSYSHFFNKIKKGF